MWGDYCRSLLIWEMFTLLQLAIYLRGSALTELAKQLVLSWAVNGISLTMQFVLTPPSICWYGSVSLCQQYALDFNRIQSFVKYGRAPWSAIWFHFNEMMYVMELWPGWDFLCLHNFGASRRFTYIYLQGFLQWLQGEGFHITVVLIQYLWNSIWESWRFLHVQPCYEMMPIKKRIWSDNSFSQIFSLQFSGAIILSPHTVWIILFQANHYFCSWFSV